MDKFIYCELIKNGKTSVVIHKDNETVLSEYIDNFQETAKIILAIARYLNIKDIYVDTSFLGLALFDSLFLECNTDVNQKYNFDIHDCRSKKLNKDIAMVYRAIGF